MKWPWYNILGFKHLSFKKIYYLAIIMHDNVVIVVGGIFLWSSTSLDF
jgi:hypothetical protein